MFHQPRELAEALELRAQLGADITPLCGGTDLLVALNRGQWRPSHVLDLSRVSGYDAVQTPSNSVSSRASGERDRVDDTVQTPPSPPLLRGGENAGPGREDVAGHNGHYVLGGGATYTQLAQLPVPALAEASQSIGGAQIRNRGTIAGNLGTASPAGDGCVALLALDATVELTHARRGSRAVAIRDFFLDYKRTALQPDELVTRVRVPGDWKTAWYKIGKRGSVNISLVCCAIGRSPEGRYCVAFGCVGPYPLRTPKTEGLLADGPLTTEKIEEAAQLVQTEVSPIDDHRASATYRRAMCGVLLKRLLMEHFSGESGLV